MTQSHDDQIICGEGYGPGGVAVLVTCSEPASALAAAVRNGFAAHGAYSGAAGSVAYLFNAVGVLEFAAGTPLAKLGAFAYEAGAEDVVPGAAGTLQVLTDPAEIQQVSARLQRRGCKPAAVQITQRAAARVTVAAQTGCELQRLIDSLRAIDGVTHVYHNAEIPALLA
jgi:transcriptional/translational regulatory protein YebC/TACO1